jgi:CII-binding regulator of phage lambda lysogenization HflD
MSKMVKRELSTLIKRLEHGIESLNDQERVIMAQLDGIYADRKSSIKEIALAQKLLLAADMLAD